MTCCGKIRSQVIGYCVLCAGGTLSAEKDKTLITNLKFPQFTSELERAGTIRDMARQQVLMLKVMHMYTKRMGTFCVRHTSVVPAKLVKRILKWEVMDMVNNNMEAERRRLKIGLGHTALMYIR